MTIRLLIGELEQATRPILGRTIERGRRVVDGWPRVSHPDLVRSWLGGDAVAEDGGLADPEAALHALAWLRWFVSSRDPGSPMTGPRPDDDNTVAWYLGKITGRLV